MARFQANFSTFPNVIYAPAKVTFTSKSTIGNPINDDFTVTVDENGKIIDLSDVLDITQVNIGAITKHEWTFDDGDLSVEENPDHIYKFPDVYQVKLSIYSDEIYEPANGIFYRVRNSVTKSVDVGSMTVSWLQQHMTQPHLTAFETSQGFKDLVSATSRMFDRMYQELTEALDLINIEKVAPRFLEFFSDTLGHKRFYSEKIGYRDQKNDEFFQGFLDYDIFDRISRGVAGQEEIQLFKKFIEDTALLFKQNGSEESMEAFFKLYGFIVDIKDLWTTNFGTEALPSITDNFFNDPTLEDTLNKFRFRDVSVSGFDNSSAHLDSNFSNLIIDNYHFVSKHVYPIDAEKTSDNCDAVFEINEIPPYIGKVIRDDGRKLSDQSPCSDFSIPSTCKDEEKTCTENGIDFSSNPDWSSSRRLKPGVNAKFWRAQDNYVQSVQNVLGPLPNDPDESDEVPSDTSDDFLWAEWKSGVTVAPGIPGVSQSFLRKPTYRTLLPNINLSTTKEDDDLISGEGITFDSSRDTFVVIRGFIKVEFEGFYNFLLDIGNTGSDSTENHVALMSLKQNTTYSEEQLNNIDSLDDLTFSRIPGDVTHTVSDGDSNLTVYGKATEYGIIEIRTDEALDTKYDFVNQDGGFYKLEPGYYAFEIKATYNTLRSKKLKLLWEVWNEVVRPSGTFFEKVQERFVIPTSSLITIDEQEIGIEDTRGKGLMNIPVSNLEGGDSLKVVYANSHSDKNNISGFISSKQKLKDLEAIVRLSPCPIDTIDQKTNTLIPSKRFGIFFRATNKEKDLFADVDTYYAFIFDGSTGRYSLSHVTYNKDSDSVFFRHLNLNKDFTDLDQRIFFDFLTDEMDQPIELEENKYYDFKIVVEDNLVSVYFRDNTEFTTAVQNVQKNIAIDIQDYNPDVDEWKLLINNLRLDQEDAQTETFNISDDRIEVPLSYKPIETKGDYGLFVINSIFKINRFIVNPIDQVDTLFENEEKWKKKKPFYLDSKNDDIINYNSYGIVGDDQPTNNTFKFTLLDDYQGESIITLPPHLNSITDNSIHRIIANNVDADDWGTRFNILLDADFVSERFNTTEELVDSIRVPLGNFLEPYIDWSLVQYRPNDDINPYKSMPHAGYVPLISDMTRVSPHTIAATATEGKSLTEFISFLKRNEDNNRVLTLNGALNTYMNAVDSDNFNIMGAWEEVAPNSAKESFEIPGLGTTENAAFDIIYNNDLPLGVKVKNSDAFEKLQCRYCEDATVWGLYDIEFPEYATNLYPPFLQTLTHFDLDDLNLSELNLLELVCDITSDENKPFEDQCDPAQLRLSKLRYFIPIGKLNKDNLNFVPPAALFGNDLVSAELLGVYSHIDSDMITQVQSESNETFILDSINEFEKLYKSKVKSNYYLDVETSFIAKVTKWNNTVIRANESSPCDPGSFLFRDVDNNEECSTFVANALIMPDNIINVLNYVENSFDKDDDNTIDPQFAADFTWWEPNDIWFKRDIKPIVPENKENHLFTGFTDVGGTFYGQEITESGLDIVLQDGYSATPGEQLIDVEWCVSTVGWDPEFFNVPGVTGSTNTDVISIGETMQAPVPFQTIATSSTNVSVYDFGNYYEDETLGKRTFSPVGTFNWFQTHSNGISGSKRNGWDISDWNNEFVNCIKFKGVYGRVNRDSVEINKYWSFFEDNIPPVGSEIVASFFNKNCKGVDGEQSPKAVGTEFMLGVSDGTIAFFDIPPVVDDYFRWTQQIRTLKIDNFTLEEDEYFVNQNTTIPTNPQSQINFRTDMFNFNRFINSKIVLESFTDKIFETEDNKTIIDDFALNREINWVTYVDNGKYYELAERDIDTELKYTSNSLPYNITTYKNNSVYQATDKFTGQKIDAVSGNTKTNLSENVVGFNSNRTFRNVMELVDVESNNYEISTDVIFDRDIFNTDFSKQFELIVKAENNYDVNGDEWGVTDFYFVGIGSFGFDVALGMRSLDRVTGEVRETFLASFGEFNVRSIEADQWYTLKAKVENNSIKVFFNERLKGEKLILNYNINKKFEKLTERYLKGEFETLQSILIGLEELSVTYPADLNSKVSEEFSFENFKEEFAGTLPIEGQYTGFRVFNPSTYVTNVKYTANLPKNYTYGSAFDSVGFNELLFKIERNFGLPDNPDVKKIDSTLRGTIFIQINDRLFFREPDGEPDVYTNKIDTFDIVKDKIIIIEKIIPEDGAIGINEFSPGENSFVWSLKQGKNIYNVTTYSDLIETIPNASNIKVIKNVSSGTIENEVGYTTGTSGTITGSNTVIAPEDEITVTIEGDRDVTWPLNGELARFTKFVRAFHEGFEFEYSILIKDRTFYRDNLSSYLDIADKNIKEVIINDSTLHLIFEDN